MLHTVQHHRAAATQSTPKRQHCATPPSYSTVLQLIYRAAPAIAALHQQSPRCTSNRRAAPAIASLQQQSPPCCSNRLAAAAIASLQQQSPRSSSNRHAAATLNHKASKGRVQKMRKQNTLRAAWSDRLVKKTPAKGRCEKLHHTSSFLTSSSVAGGKTHTRRAHAKTQAQTKCS